MGLFVVSIVEKDFTTFHENVSPVMQSNYSAKDLMKAFEHFIKPEIQDLAKLIDYFPDRAEIAKIPEGYEAITRIPFESSGQKILLQENCKYHYIDSRYQLFAFNISLKPVSD